jgi:predicted nucleic acid-binding protein
VIYFDAAYVAKCYLNEPGADRVREVAYGADGLLACAEEHGFQEIYTNDHHTLQAANHFHVTGVNVLIESG